jgi:hypothetical protein
MKCESCEKEATGTFWVAVHPIHRQEMGKNDVILAEASCEDCGQDWIDRWSDLGAPRPKGFIPGFVTNKIEEVEKYLNKNFVP